MNAQLLKRLHSIYSPSGKERKMMTFLCPYIKQLPENISVPKNKFGNLHVIKGEVETYPYLVNRIDQVSHCNHSKDFKAVRTREVIFGYSPRYKRFENLGVDDKNGMFTCLGCLKRYDPMKVAFSREGEMECRGNSEAVMPFFDDVRLVIQPDRKGNSDLTANIGYSDLCSERSVEAIEPEKWGYMEENSLMTDILTLKERGLEVSCLNVSCGYYNVHTDEEIVAREDLMKDLLPVKYIIENCTNAYPHTQSDLHLSPYGFEDEIYDILNNDPTLIPEDLYEMYSADFPHLRPDDYERICRDYRMLWKEYEEYELTSGSGYENEKILS